MKKRIIDKVITIAALVTITTAAVFNIPATNIQAENASAPVSATTSNVSANWPEAPEISAQYAILMDADTGAILYDKDSQTRSYPASITKIMTGLLTIENSRMDETVTFSPAAANSVTWEDASIGTKAGEQYTVEQSLYALLMYSANEVAYGLAEHVGGGSLSNFVDMMNKKARDLGAYNTHFNNASGLSDPNHYTTAYDLALIGKACFNNATFTSIDSHAENYILPPTNVTTTQRVITARNQLLKNKAFYYENCKGGKTGFTDESGYTFISYAEKNDMRLICVVMKEPNSDIRFTDSINLYEYGFNNFKKSTISNSDVSSLFNSSTYYNSRVYGDNSLTFNMNASFVDLPNTAATSDLGIALNANANTDNNSDNSYTTALNFTYGSHAVGNASLSVSTDAAQETMNSNLPYITSDISSIPKAKQCLVINIWIAGIIILVILIGIRIFLFRKNSSRYSYNRRNSKHRRRSRRRY